MKDTNDGRRYAWPKEMAKARAGIPVIQDKSATTEGVKSDEKLASLADKANRVWIDLFQQMTLISDPTSDGRELRAFRTDCNGSINIGKHVGAGFSLGRVDTGTNRLRGLFLGDQPLSCSELNELRKTIKSGGVVARFDNNNFFLVGKFSHEIGGGGREERGVCSSFICLSFAETTDLSKFVECFSSSAVLPSEFISLACVAGLDGHPETNRVLEGIKNITFLGEQPIGMATPFSEPEKKIIAKELKRYDD